MAPDLWTVFAAVVLPYVPYLLVAVEKNRRGVYDPANPRASDAVLAGWTLRARGAEVNSWEALAAYLATSWIAHEAGADAATLLRLGVAWVVCRVVYAAAYVAGWGRLRIAAWFVATGLMLARVGVAVG